jgi:hypothetical protein
MYINFRLVLAVGHFDHPTHFPSQDSLGCTEVCADGTPFIRDVLQWQGAQTLLREITYNTEAHILRFNPIPEVQKLRWEVFRPVCGQSVHLKKL